MSRQDHVVATFSIPTDEVISAGRRRLELVGNLDSDGAPILTERLESHLAAGHVHLELDFARVSFISSCGIGTIIASVGEYRDESGDILLLNLSASLLEVFEALELLDYVTFGTPA